MKTELGDNETIKQGRKEMGSLAGKKEVPLNLVKTRRRKGT